MIVSVSDPSYSFKRISCNLVLSAGKLILTPERLIALA